MARRRSAREILREFFLAHVGEVIETEVLRDVAGVSEYARRIRELRAEEGLNILSHRDRASLKPGQYVLESAEPIPTFGQGISASQRQRILIRNGLTCRICGLTSGDPHPLDPNRKIILHVDHIIPLSAGGKNEDSNLRTTCSACNEGRSNLEVPAREATLNLPAMFRRAPRDVQLEVYGFLKSKFEVNREAEDDGETKPAT